MLNFDARFKKSDAAQPRVTNVKTPLLTVDRGTSFPDPTDLHSGKVQEGDALTTRRPSP